MANRFAINPPDPLQALMMGVQGYEGASKRAKEGDILAARQAAAQKMGAGDYKGALADLFHGGDVAGAGVPAGLLEKQLSRAADGGHVYGNLVWGVVDGKPALGATDKSGNFRKIDTGSFSPTPNAMKVDTGTGTEIISGKFTPGGGAPQVGPQPTQGLAPQAPVSQTPIPQAAPSAPVTRPGVTIPRDSAGRERDEARGKGEGDKLATFGKAKAALDGGISSLNDFERTAKQLLGHPGLPGIIGLQGAFPSIPGGASASAQAVYDSLVAKGGFAELQKMRENSPTGGALGSVTEGEHKLLRDAFATLSRSQGTPQFKEALENVVKLIGESKLRLHGAFKQDFERLKSGEQPAPAQQAPIPFNQYFGNTRQQ